MQGPRNANPLPSEKPGSVYKKLHLHLHQALCTWPGTPFLRSRKALRADSGGAWRGPAEAPVGGADFAPSRWYLRLTVRFSKVKPGGLIVTTPKVFKRSGPKASCAT